MSEATQAARPLDQLVMRLREYAKDWRDRAASADIVIEAADEIERLQKREPSCGFDESMLEQLFWEFDSERKRRSERDVFKGKMRYFALHGQADRLTPIAWHYHIEAYCDHAEAEGTVLRKEELSDAIPTDKITWTAIYHDA